MSFGKKYFAAMPYLALGRPWNGLLAAGSVAVGYWLAAPRPFGAWSPLLAAALAAVFLINAGGNIFNDLRDREMDRINRPQRPLASGRARPRTAAVICFLAFVSGLLCGFGAGARFGCFALVNSLLLLLYSLWLKQRPLAGNVLVALLSASCFVFGGLFHPAWHLSLVPAGFAFLVHLAREIVKSLEDMAGDAAARARTLPLAWGVRPALRLAQFLLVLLLLALPVPYLGRIYNVWYLAAALLLVAGPVLPLVWRLRRPGEKPLYAAAGRRLKIIMLTGIFSLLIGGGL